MSDCCTPAAGSGRYDLAVIGAGSAGFSAAITAADQGAKVVLIGHGLIGGTCVNVGCVPSKTMIRMAEALHGARVADRFAGISGDARINDWSQVIAAKDALVATLRQKKYIDLLPEYEGVSYLEGAARITSSGVEVNGTGILADKVIVATGSSPALPDIPGLSGVPFLTSTTALELNKLPRSIMVLGGGYIGCELAQMFARTEVEVTLVTRSRLLPNAEPEISHALTGFFEEEGIKVRTNLIYCEISKTDDGIALNIEHGGKPETISAEEVILTTGRSPNTNGLGLREAGIEMLPNGGIFVDDHLRTTKPGVYAAGDVTGRDQFVYMAAYGAKLAALNAMNGDSLMYDNTAMPWVVFTDPQIAGVGLSEAAAKSAGFDTKISVLPLDQLPRALAARDTRGLIKLVADTKTDRLLGAQIIAPEGSDSIQTAVLAIRHGMTTKALGETIFPYLTTVEGLKLAAQSFGKDVTKLSCCAG
ncbi:mercury(II) reductase [Paremcibacter congregatus]|uniref:mercury(II) reductase n=1 Tax=Paremcibacter congregatus TaxID=2043170 RepID=UPI0030EF58B9|tara:strand:- start:7214 stop:8641 length:1428 start_codon:yes stop_codon:yes gene_type:complete